MYQLLLLRLPALPLAILLIAAACSGGDADPDAPAPDNSEYLEGVAAIASLLDDSNAQINETLQQAWPIRSRLIETLLIADRPALADTMLEQAQALEPPPEFAADHARLIETLEEAVRLTRIEHAAVEDDDLVAAVIALADLRLVEQNVLLNGISPAFCLALHGFGVASEDACGAANGPGSSGEYGEYGQQLFEAWQRYLRQFVPRVGVFPAALAPEERFASLRLLQPEIVAALTTAIEEVGALDPPAALATDHDRLVQYLTETRQTALDINAAAEAEDTALLLQHFARSSVVLCEAAEELSDEIDPLTAYYFPPSCGALLQ